jgi:pyridoxal phosphate enzyme (YggS family)
MKTLSDVTIVCASKYFDTDQMIKLVQLGYKDMGENRVDVFLNKFEQLKEYPIKWHFIGHLQRNKAKQVIDKIDVLHSLDSLELAKTIQSLRESPLEVFIQINATEESQKYGVDVKNLSSFYEELKKYDKIKVLGLMTMGKFDDFEGTKKAFEITSNLNQDMQLKFLSMGMSDDYELALSFHTTHVRLGRYFKSILEESHGTF